MLPAGRHTGKVWPPPWAHASTGPLQQGHGQPSHFQGGEWAALPCGFSTLCFLSLVTLIQELDKSRMLLTGSDGCVSFNLLLNI